MKSVKYQRALLVLFSAAAFVLFCGFGPADVVYDNCKSKKDYEPDCSQFRADGAGRAKNVIILIGDGMGIGQTYAGRVFVNGPDRPFSWEELPNRGLATTCSMGAITDSAASGTALSTGHKTYNGAISVGPAPDYERLETILEHVKDRKATGIITTTMLWHATPAAFSAHAKKRGQSYDIAKQMIEETGADVMLGGGSRVFQGTGGKGPDLVAEAMDRGYQVVMTNLALSAVDTQKTEKLLGLFATGSLAYESERPEDSSEPHLSEMTKVALDILGKDPRGFFLMVEGARIDHASHGADTNKLIGEVAEFDRTINLALDWARSHPGTLVIITADHETGGTEVVEADYEQGDKADIKWTSKVLLMVPHSSQQVPVYAYGPNSGAVKEHMDNTEVYCIMKNAFGE